MYLELGFNVILYDLRGHGENAKTYCTYSIRERLDLNVLINDSLKDNKIPILFIHGEEDDFILPWNSRVMREATAGYSEIHLIPGAGHAESVLKAGEDYKKYVKEFLGAVCK